MHVCNAAQEEHRTFLKARLLLVTGTAQQKLRVTKSAGCSPTALNPAQARHRWPDGLATHV